MTLYYTNIRILPSLENFHQWCFSWIQTHWNKRRCINAISHQLLWQPWKISVRHPFFIWWMSSFYIIKNYLIFVYMNIYMYTSFVCYFYSYFWIVYIYIGSVFAVCEKALWAIAVLCRHSDDNKSSVSYENAKV